MKQGKLFSLEKMDRLKALDGGLKEHFRKINLEI
jgi:hypothetical protein